MLELKNIQTDKTLEQNKVIRFKSIIHDKPRQFGIENLKSKYKVRVVSENEDMGRGCIHCSACVVECTHNLKTPETGGGVFYMEEVAVDIEGTPLAPETALTTELVYYHKVLHIVEEECCNCKRCVKMCPQGAIQITDNPEYFNMGVPISNSEIINDMVSRSVGESLIGSAHLGRQASKLQKDWLIDAAEILSPQRDHKFEYAGKMIDMTLGKGMARFPVKSPIFDANQSYGSNSHEAVLSRLIACIKLGRPFFTGEGFLHPDMMAVADQCIVQFGSGGYGPWIHLDKFAGFNMKYGQDAKKGKGGHLDGKKNDIEIALIRCVEALRPLTSPNPQHLQYSIEELPMRVETLRALLGPSKLIGADAYGTAWNFEHIIVALAKAGFDYITIKAGDGSTGAAHKVDLQNSGLNIVYLTHIADMALRKEGLRKHVSIISEGGVRDSFSSMLVLLAGADFVGMGMPHLFPLGCTLCSRCHTGQCSWGITSRRYGTRLDPEDGAKRIVKMVQSMIADMEGLAGGMGMSNHADIVGARRFRYHGSDPLLFNNFGIQEWPGQMEMDNYVERKKNVLKNRDYFKPTLTDLELQNYLNKINGDSIEIDVGIVMKSIDLNYIMKEASLAGVRKFVLKNAGGQRYIGTGINAESIDIYGLSGNNSFAFVQDTVIRTHSRKESILIAGNVQVGVANGANVRELNIAGDANDLFASYAVSGTYRVARGSGVRSLLLFKAGIPELWKKIDFNYYSSLNTNEKINELLRIYQKRKGYIDSIGYDMFIESLRPLLNERKPPVAIFGLGKDKVMGDYFMEYSQGGIGIILNIFDHPIPIGYYTCSGLSAGAAFVRGKVPENRLGIGVRLITAEEDKDIKLLTHEINGYINAFENEYIDDDFTTAFDDFKNKWVKNPDSILSEFMKIVPAN
ncbi:MAG: glutamate synthase-related protein [Spirochaetia bacterium]|nr:glutamate synthase-related protein [Spirochaetia bacterium]